MLTAGSSVAELWQNHHKSFTNIFNNCWFPTEFYGILAVFYAGKTVICSIKFFSRRWGIEVMLKWFHQFFNCSSLYSTVVHCTPIYRTPICSTVAHCADYSLIAFVQRGLMLIVCIVLAVGDRLQHVDIQLVRVSLCTVLV